MTKRLSDVPTRAARALRRTYKNFHLPPDLREDLDRILGILDGEETRPARRGAEAEPLTTAETDSTR